MGKRFSSIEERRKYYRDHYAVGKKWGRAADYLCDICDAIAAEWAHEHDSDPSNPDNYWPMCRKCHQRYDDRWNEEERRRLGETLRRIGHRPPDTTGTKRSEETKQKMSESQKIRFARDGHHRTGSHHSEEVKKRISESNKATKARQRGEIL